MNREQMIDYMIDIDIADIKQAIHNEDYAFLYAVLSGNGWIPYNQLNNDAIEQNYHDYKLQMGLEV
jgi:hypothetical protein